MERTIYCKPDQARGSTECRQDGEDTILAWASGHFARVPIVLDARFWILTVWPEMDSLFGSHRLYLLGYVWACARANRREAASVLNCEPAMLWGDDDTPWVLSNRTRSSVFAWVELGRGRAERLRFVGTPDRLDRDCSVWPHQLQASRVLASECAAELKVVFDRDVSRERTDPPFPLQEDV